MNKIRRIGAGGRMSKAVLHGDTIFTAGQVADKCKGADVKAQTVEILGVIDEILAEVGSDKSKILSATIYLADISTFAQMNAAWDAWVDKANPPARATVEAKLVAPITRWKSPSSPRSDRWPKDTFNRTDALWFAGLEARGPAAPQWTAGLRARIMVRGFNEARH